MLDCCRGRFVRALDNRPGGTTDTSSYPLRNILVFFYSSQSNKIIFIRRESRGIKFYYSSAIKTGRSIYTGSCDQFTIKPEPLAIVYYINWLVLKVCKKLSLLKWISCMVISIKLLKRLKQLLNNIPKYIILFV